MQTKVLVYTKSPAGTHPSPSNILDYNIFLTSVLPSEMELWNLKIRDEAEGLK